MLNRKASSKKNKPEKIMGNLALQQGQTIADIGIGGGYYALRFAKAVGPEGTVYAVDTNPTFLELLSNKARKKGVKNIKTVPASRMREMIPEKTLDHVFLRNAYHHLEDRIRYFKDLRALLKPEAGITIIEYMKDRRCGPKGHYVPKEKIVEEMEQAGYTVEKSRDFLSEQSYTVFKL